MCEAVKQPLLVATPYEKDRSFSRKCFEGSALLITKSAKQSTLAKLWGQFH